MLEITPHTANGDALDGMYHVAGGSVQGAATAVLTHNRHPITVQVGWFAVSPKYKMLVYGNKCWYHLTGKYFESADGAYLGMKAEEVRRIYGEPDSREGTFPYEIWHYEKEGAHVYIYANVVTDIRLEKGCKKTFRRSGLGADDDWNSYAAYYGGVTYPDEEVVAASEEDSEYIRIDDSGILLTSLPY